MKNFGKKRAKNSVLRAWEGVITYQTATAGKTYLTKKGIL